PKVKPRQRRAREKTPTVVHDPAAPVGVAAAAIIGRITRARTTPSPAETRVDATTVVVETTTAATFQSPCKAQTSPNAFRNRTSRQRDHCASTLRVASLKSAATSPFSHTMANC